MTDTTPVNRAIFDRVRRERDQAEGKLTRLARRLDEAHARGHRTVPVDTLADVLGGTEN